MTAETSQIANIADKHLAADSEAVAYIRRAAACLKTAAEISPHLVTKLGTPHSLLSDLLAELEQRR